MLQKYVKYGSEKPAKNASQDFYCAQGGGRQDLRTPLRFQNSFSIAFKGKKTYCKTGKISIFKKNSPTARFLFLNLDFFAPKKKSSTPPPT